MKMADQTEALSIANKLRCLKENKEHLLNSIERYVDGIVAAANSWSEGGASRDEFVLLSQKIDCALEILSQRFVELTEPVAYKPRNPMPKKRAVSFNVNRRSYPSCEQPDLTAQPTEAATASSSSSSSQPLKTWEAEDENKLMSVLARLAVVEEAMCSFRNNAEKVAEKQSNIDQQLKELWSRINEAYKNGSSRLDIEAEKQKSDLQDAIEKNQNTSIQSPEKQAYSESNLKVQTQKDAIVDDKLIDHIINVWENVYQQSQATLETSIADCTSKCSTLGTVVQSLLLYVESSLQEAEKKLSSMQTRLQPLETRMSSSYIAFSAQAWATRKSPNRNITNYTVSCNVGNHFNAANGLFTAPEDGLYMASIALWTLQCNTGAVGIKHRRKDKSECNVTSVCEIVIGNTNTSTCNVGVICMRSGDVLFAYSSSDFKEMVTLSCVKFY